MTTMEEVIAEEARAIKELAASDLGYSMEDVLEGIKHKADNILRTIEEADPA